MTEGAFGPFLAKQDWRGHACAADFVPFTHYLSYKEFFISLLL